MSLIKYAEEHPVLHSLGHAISTFLYISLVAFLMFNGKEYFGEFHNFLGPVFMLLLFVLSATITGTLVLGPSIFLYLDGKKKEALKFFGFIILWLFIITVVIFIIAPWR